MERKIKEIEQKISNKIKENTTYIHPIISNELIAKLVSAYSNGMGGDIIFGIKDDGIEVNIKTFSFEINMDKVLDLLSSEVKVDYNFFTYQNKNLFYISVDKSAELIMVNDTPYEINKRGEVKEMETRKVFISYAHRDRDLVDILEREINENKRCEITRDIKITEYKDSLDEFMKTIRNHDYVISIVTSAYLKSLNCMYEITELMKEQNFEKKLIFIIVDKKDSIHYRIENVYDNFEAGIYQTTDRLDYITYWHNEKEKIARKTKEAELPLELLVNLTADQRKLSSVLPSVDDFIKMLSDRVGRSFNQMYENDFKEIIDILNK